MKNCEALEIILQPALRLDWSLSEGAIPKKPRHVLIQRALKRRADFLNFEQVTFSKK